MCGGRAGTQFCPEAEQHVEPTRIELVWGAFEGPTGEPAGPTLIDSLAAPQEQQLRWSLLGAVAVQPLGVAEWGG
jgi:hypothetical protein